MLKSLPKAQQQIVFGNLMPSRSAAPSDHPRYVYKEDCGDAVDRHCVLGDGFSMIDPVKDDRNWKMPDTQNVPNVRQPKGSATQKQGLVRVSDMEALGLAAQSIAAKRTSKL